MRKRIANYAYFIAKHGINVEKDEIVVIDADIFMRDFVLLLTKSLYELGAKDVIVKYSDRELKKIEYEYKTFDLLKEVYEHEIIENKYYLDKKASFIFLCSSFNNDLDKYLEKISIKNKERYKQLGFIKEARVTNYLKSCICAVATKEWAGLVYKDIHLKTAYQMLWENILDFCYINEEKDFSLWEEKTKKLVTRSNKLNNLDISYLHFKNSLGTDLCVYLVDDYIFCGGDEYSMSNKIFAPNIPTEEIFTTPNYKKTTGTVFSTKPLIFNGQLIDKFYLEFKDGKVINYDAVQGKEALKSLLSSDEMSQYIGEVALVSHDSNISKSNKLFYNTLIDENASCHLALGDSYKTCQKDKTITTNEEFLKKGCNCSQIHVDFMFGSSCMNVKAYLKNGKSLDIIKNGIFVI